MGEHIPKALGETGVAGASIALIRDGEVVWAEAYGTADASTGRPVTTDTVFEVASITKPLFTYGVLKLRNAGVLDLDTPLDDYLDEPYLDDPRIKKVTARHVLSHQGGFPNWQRQRDEGPLKMYFEPGERYSYSGEGFQYLKLVVEKLTGRPALDVISELTLEPFGMSESDFVWPSRRSDPPLALGHEKDGSPREKRQSSEMNAAASLVGSPTEVARFMTWMMRDDAHPDALPVGTLNEMLTPEVPVNNSQSWHTEWPRLDAVFNHTVSWGLGWSLEHQPNTTGPAPWFWHWGDNSVYFNFAIGSRESRSGVVVLTNGAFGYTLWKDVVYIALGGEHPSLDWVADVYSSRHRKPAKTP
jgi:CubicO group peptidase (beta-lactamase class C family)|tara:strand:- start:306 stop:1379 length:1074 start_codon:yes stop_codon:yes gene_type:complete